MNPLEVSFGELNKTGGVSVILPCFNEALNVKHMFDKIRSTFEGLGLNFESIFVDDFSSDGTGDEVRALGDPRALLINHSENRGIFEAWRSGVAQARFPLVCLIDADGQNPPEEIKGLYECLATTGVSFVQGRRSSIGRIKDNRFLYSKVLNKLLQLLFGDSEEDIKSGFIFAEKKMLEEVLNSMPPGLKMPHTFIKLQARCMGLTIKTKETLFRSRHLGQSFISAFPIGLVLSSLADIVKYRVYYGKSSKLTDLERFLATSPPPIEPRPRSFRETVLLKIFFVSFPIHKWKVRKRVEQIYEALRRSQYWTAHQLEEYQNFKLRKLIAHAYHNTIYYKKMFDSLGVRPFDVKTVDDLDRIKVLDKSDVNKFLYFDLFSATHNKKEMYKISTSGSTGTPFSIYVDVEQLELRMATTMRAWENAGWCFGDKQLRLWHQTIGMSTIEIIKEKIDAFLNNRVFIPAFEITEKNIQGIIEKIERVNPVLIDGYAECLVLISRYAGRKLNLPHLKAVISSAQMLTEESRKEVEQTFGAKVVDKYGAREFSGIAYESLDGSGYPIMAESYVVRKVKFSDELSRILITDLNNYSVPIINYQIGDLVSDAVQVTFQAKVPEIELGAELKHFPRLGRIEGRIQSVVHLPNGRLLPSAFFMHFMKDYEDFVRIFQFVQAKNKTLRLDVVPAPGWRDEIKESLRDELNKHIQMDDFVIRVVDDIPLIRTGKRLAVKVEQ
jgi:phenylacetate-CoA ligase